MGKQPDPTSNDETPIWDAYEEVLDLAAYLRQVIGERKARHGD